MTNAAQVATLGNRRRPAFELQDRLRKARELTGLEKQDFAEQLGIHRDSVSNYESGKRQPRRPVLVAWSLAAGVDLDWLIEGECAPRDLNPEPTDAGFDSDVPVPIEWAFHLRELRRELVLA